MTSRERVYNALKKKAVDRVPVFMWYHPVTKRHLAKLLEIPPDYVTLAFGDDIRQTWVHNNYAMENVPLNTGQIYVDEWGIEWTRQGEFNQIHAYPLATASIREINAYHFPDDKIDHLLSFMQPLVQERQDYFIGCDISPNIFEMYWRLRGLERAMYDLLEKNDSTRQLLNKCSEFSLTLAEKAMQRYDLDWIWLGDDAGSQANMLISPQMWRELVKPQLKPIIDLIRSNNMTVAFHSCGAIRPIIADLVEIGIDVLNPVQSNCPGMDPLELKKEYGAHIAFMGGVDTQGLLPNGNAAEVFRATSDLIKGMTGDGGGYILAASHTVPPETPDENIFAMYDAAGISREEIMDNASTIRSRLSF
jgi:uroporphyrinogen decarboxylase